MFYQKNIYQSEKANQLLETVVKSRNKTSSNSKLRSEKYNLIKEIKENYNVSDFLNVRIPNYKILASIYNIFQSLQKLIFDVEDVVNSKFTILENIVGKKNN